MPDFYRVRRRPELDEDGPELGPRVLPERPALIGPGSGRIALGALLLVGGLRLLVAGVAVRARS